MKQTRVCLFTSQYPPQTGGLGHSTHRIANLLASQGMVVHVAAFHKSNTALPFDEAITTCQEEGVTVHRVAVWNPGWHNVVDEEGVPLTETDVLTRYNREIFDVMNHLQERYRFDLFHAFFLYPAGFLATAVAKYHGINCIVSIRGNDVGKYLFDPLRLPFVQQALANADYVTSVAGSLLELADRAFVPGGGALNGRSAVILNSIDMDKVRVNGRPNLPLTGPVIGTVGLFRYKKGLIYLFKALAELKHTHDFTLFLAGDYFNAKEAQLHQAQLDALGLADRTVISGRFPHSEVYSYIQLFDILVYPSLFAEGCPLSMLEAMALRRPIIASRAGAIPEIITHNHDGLLVEQGSSHAIAAAIAHLLANPTERTRLGNAAYERIQTLNPDHERQAWLSVYQTVLANSHAANKVIDDQA